MSTWLGRGAVAALIVVFAIALVATLTVSAGAAPPVLTGNAVSGLVAGSGDRGTGFEAVLLGSAGVLAIALIQQAERWR
jgi:hypothetical protein